MPSTRTALEELCTGFYEFSPSIPRSSIRRVHTCRVLNVHGNTQLVDGKWTQTTKGDCTRPHYDRDRYNSSRPLMDDSISIATFLNPDAYLNHLPPEEAAQFEVLRNVYIVVLGATIWDILSYIPEDIRIVRTCGGWITNTCFLLARVLAVVYLGLWVIVASHPVVNCNLFMSFVNASCLLAMSVTSFLFLRRVQAVYTGNRIVYWISALLWFSASILDVTLFPGTHFIHIPGTQYCIVYAVAGYVSASSFMLAVFDSLVFFAISYKIAFQSMTLTGSSWSTFFSGKTLPALSRAILHGGQRYYLMTLGVSILNGAFEFSPSVPPLYKTLFGVPAAALVACMACHAHRVMAIAFHFEDLGGSAVTGGICFAPPDRFPKGTIKSQDQAGGEARTSGYGENWSRASSPVGTQNGPGRLY